MDKGQRTVDKGKGLWTIGLRKGLLAFVLCPLSFVLPAAAAPTSLTPSTTAEKPVALLNATQKDYLYTMDIEGRRTAITKNSATYATLFCYGSPVELKWSGTSGECTVEVRKLPRTVAEAATVREGTVVWTGTTRSTSVTVYNLEAGAGYEWTVTCGGASASATFYTEETAPRLVRTGLIKNLRDLGGWTGTLGGKSYKVRQNLLFRGGAADDPKTDTYLITDDSDRDFLYNVVGLKNEVDFRALDNPYKGDVTQRALTSGEYKLDLTGLQVTYNNISIENNETDLKKNPNFPAALKLLTNPEKLPAYFHCKSGRDRTGTAAAVLLAVLGVSDEDIVRDYQTTSDKDNYDKTTETQTYFGGFKNFLYNKLAKYKDAGLSLAENASAYLRDCGITEDEIETFRETMLEGYADPSLPEYDMSGVTFADKTVTYNGQKQSIAVGGTLPAGVSVSYDGGGTDAGTHTVTAHFTGDADHAPIADRTATLTINKATITSATAATAEYTGATITPTLTVKAGSLDVPAMTGYTVGSWSRASGTGTIRRDVGKYYATVKGTGNFNGSTVVYFEIVAPEPPPPAEETIEVVEDQSVTRTLSFGEEAYWLFGGEHAFANASAELDIGYIFITGSVDYHYMSTRKVSEVTVTLTGVLAGEERIFVARRAADNSFVPMAIYTVKVMPRERTPYEKLCAAFAAGGEYALGEDVECPAEGLLELGAGRSLKLDLNGHSILCHEDEAIRNAGDLEIFDSTASDPFAAHVAFGEDELGAGHALIRNRPGATLTVDGVWIEAGLIDATGDYEFGGGNTAVLAQGGLVSVTGGGHLGGLVGIDVTGPTDVFIDGGAEVIADTWRSGGLQLGTCVRFSDGDSSLTVADALLESEGRIVQSLAGSELEATFSGATLRSSRASAPFDLADGATVSFADSSYEDLTAATRISQVTALANAGAALSVGAGCTLTVANEGVIGFLADGVTAEADGARTWRTAKAGAPEGKWAEISRKLGAETEFANEPAIAFGAADVVLADDGLAMRVTVAVRDGSAVKAVDPDKVKAYFEATDDLSDWGGGAIGLDVTSAVRNADGTMAFTLKLASASPQAFVRIRVR